LIVARTAAIDWRSRKRRSAERDELSNVGTQDVVLVLGMEQPMKIRETGSRTIVHVGSRAMRIRAFTLVELLVVIGIIALLISILLPALAAARREAQALKCEANIRSIVQAAHLYAAEWKGYFPGGPATTGRRAFTSTWATDPAYNNSNWPDTIAVWDWMSPSAQYLNIKFDTGASATSRAARFDYLRKHPALSCPANEVIGPLFAGGVTVPTDVIVSYNIATQFHLMPVGTGGAAGVTQGSADLTAPPSYSPQFVRVGDASSKIYIADGARYSNAGTQPDIDLNYDGSGGGAFGDVGPWTVRTNSWDRSLCSGNSPRGATDARIYAYRHGVREQKKGPDAYRFNAGFFDGHVERLGDLQGADPRMWLPKGTVYNPSGSFAMSNDVKALYGAGVSAGIQ
jgi:prepilin-type N-terminal cleavage/methylation domain-containing protein/prepilin-type processing-associated H-X9-DG protein